MTDAGKEKYYDDCELSLSELHADAKSVYNWMAGGPCPSFISPNQPFSERHEWWHSPLQTDRERYSAECIWAPRLLQQRFLNKSALNHNDLELIHYIVRLWFLPYEFVQSSKDWLSSKSKESHSLFSRKKIIAIMIGETDRDQLKSLLLKASILDTITDELVQFVDAFIDALGKVINTRCNVVLELYVIHVP